MNNNITERAEEQLETSHLKTVESIEKCPYPKLRKVLQFARDAAKYILINDCRRKKEMC